MLAPRSFQPSQDGFVFTNAWPSEPAVVLPTPFGKINIGNAAAGLCGGMVFAALDYWHTGILPPATRPAPGEPLYRYIVRRLVDSWHLPAGVAQYYQWMNLPDGDSGFEVFGRRVVTDQGACVAHDPDAVAADRGRPRPRHACGPRSGDGGFRQPGRPWPQPPGAGLRL
jgi:hypothetical protein